MHISVLNVNEWLGGVGVGGEMQSSFSGTCVLFQALTHRAAAISSNGVQ